VEVEDVDEMVWEERGRVKGNRNKEGTQTGGGLQWEVI